MKATTTSNVMIWPSNTSIMNLLAVCEANQLKKETSESNEGLRRPRGSDVEFVAVWFPFTDKDASGSGKPNSNRFAKVQTAGSGADAL